MAKVNNNYDTIHLDCKDASLGFEKWQALGNDFILIESTERDFFSDRVYFRSDAWKKVVSNWCDRQIGIGADGILLYFDGECPEVLIFNADGTDGQFSGNGIRCAASHYFLQHSDKDSVVLLMGGKQIYCEMSESESKDELSLIFPSGSYEGSGVAIAQGKKYEGDLVSVGNPHFLIPYGKPQAIDVSRVFETLDKIFYDLSLIGEELVEYQGEGSHRNVHFYWKTTIKAPALPLCTGYMVSSCERGVGMTAACTSGALALLWSLYTKGEIAKEELSIVFMLGGPLELQITSDEKMKVTGSASFVFTGSLLWC